MIFFHRHTFVRTSHSHPDSMVYDFVGKVAVVTGASRGIGRGIALEFARNGADVVGTYVSREGKAREVQSELSALGVTAKLVKCDVRRETEILDLRDDVLKEFGKADVLVNNAGIHQHLKSWEIDLEDWNRVIATNLTGPFLMAKAFIPSMKEAGYGRIVNISSCVAYSGTDHEVHYASSKSGIISFTKSLALELAPYGINVNAIAPGYIDTDMVAFGSDEEKQQTLASIPKGRLGHPSDIAKTVSFLCSQGADYITGEMLHVNGGLLMH